VTAREIARVLAEISVLSELNDPKPFRARAYMAAARVVETGGHDLPALAAEDQLTSIPGVGGGIAETIRELIDTGRSTVHQQLRASTPAGLYDLLKIPGLGPRKVRSIHEALGIESLDELESAVQDGRVARLSGFGAKTAERIRTGIAFVRAGTGRLRYPDARAVADRLIELFGAAPGVGRVEAAGELRRSMELVEQVVVVIEHVDPSGAGSLPLLGQLRDADSDAGAAFAGELVDGARVRVVLAPPERFGSVWVQETGSDAHLDALRERASGAGLGWPPAARLPDARDEEAFYRSMRLPWIPPELREGLGEVEAAAAAGLPELIRSGDLRGTFHCHTTYSDGKGTLEEMAEGARERGWEYLGIADHSQSAAYAGGLSPARVAEQLDAIDAWNRARPAEQDGTADPARRADPRTDGGASTPHAEHPRPKLLKGIESDILPDGSLDYPDELLARFDYVVGSVHSGFRMSPEEMTERVIRAVRNPFLTILGHPTGRRLLSRDGYSLDVRAVLDAAADHDVIVEINANPHRLDLDWRHLRYAVQRGVLIAINPDAHSVSSLDDVAFGVNMARKGWLTARDVLNTWKLEEVEALLARRKARIEEGA
jgi:DNA polymerase (family X)